MPRILMVLDHSYPPDIRVENEAETLSDAGYDVTILAIGPDHRPRENNESRVRIVRDRISGGLRNKMRGLAGSLPILSQYVARRMGQIYREWPFDAVHAHDLYLVGGALIGGRRLGVRVIADLHEYWAAAIRQYAWSNRYPGKLFNDPGRWEHLETKWVSAADGAVVVIEEMAERLICKGITHIPVAVVPNTIQRARFDAALENVPGPKGKNNALVLLYTGGMDRHRGLETAIRAMPTVLESIPGAQLILVGDGAVRSDLETLTAHLGLSESVLFKGWQTQDSIPGFIATADIGLIPHLKSDHTDHTIPHKLFHYMHMGLPVIASNCRPLERIVSESGSGFVFNSGDDAGLAAVVIEAARDSRRMRSLGENGRRAIRDTYHWEKTSQPLIDLYAGLLPIR